MTHSLQFMNRELVSNCYTLRGSVPLYTVLYSTPAARGCLFITWKTEKVNYFFSLYLRMAVAI